MSSLKEAYEWAKIPTNLSKENLVLVTAKTTKTTIHPENPTYPIRIFTSAQLAERAASLAQRPVGFNHAFIIDGAYTVDAQWNEETQAIETLLYLPTFWINKIKNKEISNKVSVEYTWRDEKHTDKGIEFEGFVFNRVDLLSLGSRPGDSDTNIKLLTESKRGLMEGIIEVPEDSKLTPEEEKCEAEFELDKELHEAAMTYLQTLGEPFAGFKDWGACIRYAKRKGAKDPEAYCGYIKSKAEPKKESILTESTPTQPTQPTTTPPSTPPAQPEPPPPGTQASNPIASSTPPTQTTQPTPAPTEPINATLPVQPAIQPTIVAPAPPDAKDVRIVELEATVTQLQENIKTADATKKKAVEEAVKAKEKEVIDKIEKVLPPGEVISKFNRGGQRLAEDIRRVIYKSKREE